MFKLAPVTGRLALVVGSQCAQMRPLGFVEPLSRMALQALAPGQWWSLTGPEPLLNPDTAQLKHELESAFIQADSSGAALLVWFIGHGVARGAQDFYLMTRDAPYPGVNSDNGFNLVQYVRERLKDFTRINGLVCVIDACGAGEGIEGAARRWLDVVARNKGRMDMLVASDDGDAYDGCFTRTIVDVFAAGVADGGAEITCEQLLPPLRVCHGHAEHLAFSGPVANAQDRGLWLVPNRATSLSAVTGRPASGLVDQLTNTVVMTSAIRDGAAAIEEFGYTGRLRLVTGPAGSGKSTLLALLLRPKLARARGLALDIRDDYVSAAVFLESVSTIETFVAELAAQLNATVPEFAEAAADVAIGLTADDIHRDMWQLSILRPLSRCTSITRLHIVIDGLDQPESAAQQLILAAIAQIVDPHSVALQHVRVIVGVRSGVGLDTRGELASAHRIELVPPSTAVIGKTLSAGYVGDDGSAASRHEAMPADGGWLLARLIRELGPNSPQPEVGLWALVGERIRAALPATDDAVALTLLGLVTATGVGPALPLRLLTAALGGALTASEVRHMIVAFGALITRANPGLADETVGIAHHALLGPIADCLARHGYDIKGFHRGLIMAHTQFGASRADVNADLDVEDYWATAGPRHHIGCRDLHGANALLLSLDSVKSTTNRDRWASWLSAFLDAAGPDDAEVFKTRGYLAAWRGAAGDSADAVADYARLLADHTRTLGADHPETLCTREYLANWRGVAGDHVGVIADYELLVVDRSRVLGENHQSTLAARISLAEWRGDTGDAPRAVSDFEVLIADLTRILGPNHLSTQAARSDLAGWRGGVEDFDGAIEDYEALLQDRTHILGPAHRLTFITRSHLAGWRGKRDGDDRALADYQALLIDQSTALGGNHEDCLNTRHLIADRRGRTGHVTQAVRDYQHLLHDMAHVLGAKHPEILRKRALLTYWLTQTGSAPPIASPIPPISFPIDRFLPPEISSGLSITWR